MSKLITVSNSFQKNYHYTITEQTGQNFDPEFKPELSPKQMIDLGVFGGHYDTINEKEFPKEWFTQKHLQHEEKDKQRNFFKVRASQPLEVWQQKGWIHPDDPQGWFLWYCRYYVGRRIPEEDDRQIKRWKAFARHIGQLKKWCTKGDLSCRPRQRQALLHWAYDSRKM